MADETDHSRKVLFVVCAATFFGVLNASAVNVILPQIGRSFDVGPGLLGWVMSIFLLVYGVAIPFYGKLADRYGSRNLFIAGIGLFGIGTVGCALAPSLGSLLAARVVQGLGGAAFPGLGMALASAAAPPDQRGAALGYIAATLGVGAAVGPIVGGVVADLMSWRTLFAVSALAVVVIPTARASLPGDPGDRSASLDLPGGALLATLVASALYAVAEGSRVGWSPLVTGAAITAAVTGAALVVHQARAREPFLPRALIRSTLYRRAVTMAFCSTGSYLAILIGIPLVLSGFHGLTPFEIGMVLLPEAIAMAVMGIVAGKLTDRYGARMPTVAGALLLAAVALGMSSTAGTSIAAAVVFGAALGVGYSLLNTPIATAISTFVEPRVLASALSLNAMVFFIGGSFGTTAYVTIAEARTGAGAAWNPLNGGAAHAFSDAFLVFAVPMLLAAALAATLRKPTDADRPVEAAAPLDHAAPAAERRT